MDSSGWESNLESRDGGDWWLHEDTEDELEEMGSGRGRIHPKNSSWPWPATEVRLKGRKRKRGYVVWGREMEEEEEREMMEVGCAGQSEGTTEDDGGHFRVRLGIRTRVINDPCARPLFLIIETREWPTGIQDSSMNPVYGFSRPYGILRHHGITKLQGISRFHDSDMNPVRGVSRLQGASRLHGIKTTRNLTTP